MGCEVMHKGSKLSRLLNLFFLCMRCLNYKLVCCCYAGLTFGCGGVFV